jgi:uncharacterized damage-inducible protein DinB
MDPRLTPLLEILRLNARLFRNCLDGLDEATARARPTPHTNSAAYVAGHLAESKFSMLKLVGTELPNPLSGFTGEWKGIEDIAEWPSLAAIAAAMTTASEALERRFATVSAAELDATVDRWFPEVADTVLGRLNFMVHHESYHIGQLSLLRKHAGLPAMSYN